MKEQNKKRWTMQTKIGPLSLMASERGLCGIFFGERKDGEELRSLKGEDPASRILLQTVRQLEEYFAGARRDFDLPTDVDGTEFQKRVWSELEKIPYGNTASYSDVARRIRNDKAVRAVGTANGRNPLPIIVPCHRVIAADGTLGGYGGGLKIKTVLLDLERS